MMDNLLYIVLFIIVLFIFMQVFVRFNTYLKKGKKVDGVEGLIGSKIDSGQRNLLYFYSNGCAACKPMGPVIERLQDEFENVHKINVANNMDTTRKFGVMGTPSTIIVENQKITSFLVGAKSESYLRKLLQTAQ